MAEKIDKDVYHIVIDLRNITQFNNGFLQRLISFRFYMPYHLSQCEFFVVVVVV